MKKDFILEEKSWHNNTVIYKLCSFYFFFNWIKNYEYEPEDSCKIFEKLCKHNEKIYKTYNFTITLKQINFTEMKYKH